MSCPGAITAPEIIVKVAQPPMPTTRTAPTPMATGKVAADGPVGRGADLGGGKSDGRQCDGHHALSCRVATFAPVRCAATGLGSGSRGRPKDALEHLVLRAEGLGPPVGHHQDHVDGRKGAGAVRHDNADAAALPHTDDGLGQGVLALPVEI